MGTAIERSHATAGRHLLQAVAVGVKLGHDALSGVFPRRAGHEGLGVGGKAVTVAEIQVELPGVGAASCAADQQIRLASPSTSPAAVSARPRRAFDVPSSVHAVVLAMPLDEPAQSHSRPAL